MVSLRVTQFYLVKALSETTAGYESHNKSGNRSKMVRPFKTERRTLVLFNQALGAAGTRIDQSSYSGQSGKVWDVFRQLSAEIIGKYIPYTASSVTGFFRCSMILREFQRPSSTPS